MIHIIPLNDSIEHQELTTCECCPSVQFENGEMLVIHNRVSHKNTNICDKNIVEGVIYKNKHGL